MKRSLIIMAKIPRAGEVKTRLQPFLTAEECAALADAFLRDTIEKCENAGEKIIIAFAPSSDEAFLRDFAAPKYILVAQNGKDLGERMLNAFKFAFAGGSDSAVMIGTDSPTFPVDFIEQAFEFLETETDVVLGKTEDGGFYLIGLRVLAKEIFETVEWSSPETFEQVYRNISKTNLHLREVPSWYDVDEKADFEKLCRELLKNENARRRAPETFQLLKRWGKL